MHRSLTIVLILSFLAEFVSAQTLTVERARRLAPEGAELTYVAGSLNKPDFCVFNNVGKKGFVIVSPDEAFGDGLILGYSDEGTFDYDKLPDNAKWLLSQYQEQIKYIREHNIAADVANPISVGSVVVAPLLADVKWNQSYPFNELCPLDGNQRSVTGCVATAMAQIMWYYKWPLSGTGTHSYKWHNQTLTVDYSKSEYDWSHMPGRYISKQYGAEDVAAVSRLMYDCGVSVDMEYSAGGSGTYSYLANDAFKKYFKYKSASYSYNSGSVTRWNNTLTNELNNRRPVYMGGQSEDGGHAFVCDGYDSNNYFHFNFGWGGMGNGYFLSSIAGGYSQQQECVYNIRPDKQKIVSDGLYYNQLCADKAELSFPDDEGVVYSGKVVVPAEVSDSSSVYKVTSIGSYAFAKSDVSALDIPACIGQIAASAMYGCGSIDSIFVHWNEPLDCDISIFDNSIYSYAVLVVPEGTVDAYSKRLPWSMFSNIVSEEGTSKSEEWTAWELKNENVCPYIYGWNTFDIQAKEVVVYSRSNVTSDNKVQFKVDNWLSSSLLINVDMLTGECSVPKQTTGVFYNDDEIIACDYPTYSRKYNYQSYPCTYDESSGIVILNLVYCSGARDGYYYMGVDSLFTAGYPKYGISIDKASVNGSGEVSCTINYESDVARYGYVIMPRKLSVQEINQVLGDIKSGKVEPEYQQNTKLTAQLTESDAYTLIVVSVNAKGGIQKHDYEYLSYIANEPEWVEEYVGSYYYQAWKKVTQKDVHLLHDANNPRYWKLSSLYNDSEFIFRWYDDQTLEFDDQPSGFLSDINNVTVCDNKYSDKSQKKGSYYDSSRNTLYFDTYYSASITKYALEAFVIEVASAVDDITSDSQQEPLIFNLYGHRLDYPQKGLNIINGQKVYIP